MKILFFVLIVFIPTIVFGQARNDHNIYLFGNVSKKILSNTVIRFSEADPKAELEIVKYFEKHKVESISWNSLFTLDKEYTPEEFDKIIKDNKIKTLPIGLKKITRLPMH